MPLPEYTLIHRNARISDPDVDAIFRWTQAERSRLITENLPGARQCQDAAGGGSCHTPSQSFND